MHYQLHCGKRALIFCLQPSPSFPMLVPAFSWGILLYENLYALNIVTGGDLSATLNCRKHRLILGLMVRETRAVSLPACLPAYLPILRYVRLL